MARILIWTPVVLVLLFAAAALVLSVDSSAEAESLRVGLRESLAEAIGGGEGFGDGHTVYRTTSPCRITIDELDDLEGRLHGSDYDSGVLNERLTYYGLTLRSALAQALGTRPDLIEGVPALDEIWVDVDASQVHGPFADVRAARGDLESAVAKGLLEAYGLEMARGCGPAALHRLQAGERWSLHGATGDPYAPTRVVRDDGYVMVENGTTEPLRELIERTFQVDDTSVLPSDRGHHFALSWRADDAESLRRALAEQLDLHLIERIEDVEHVLVLGVPEARGRS